MVPLRNGQLKQSPLREAPLNSFPRLALILAILALAFAPTARAQQIDVAVGGASIYAPAGSLATGNHEPQSLDGGAYPTASADWLFHKRIGVQAELAWRWNNGTYLPGYINLPYRPFFYDFNAIYASQILPHHLAFEVLGGAGVQTTRFYVQGCNGSSCYGTSNHLMGDVGGGIKYYAWRHLFIRPEARYYIVRNNIEFSSFHALRYGASIGYTFR